jgi:hypothetical protein
MVFLEQPIKMFLAVTEPEASSPLQQKHVIGIYFESHNLTRRLIIVLLSSLWFGLPSGIFLHGFPASILFIMYVQFSAASFNALMLHAIPDEECRPRIH